MKKIIIAILVIIALGFIGYFVFKDSNSPNLQSNENQESDLPSKEDEVKPNFDIEVESTSGNSSGGLIITQIHEITYTDAGYLPKELKIKLGDTITWKNQSSVGSWVGSALHPTHTVYSGTSLQEHCPDTANTSFDECKSSQPGESWSFTFNKKGTWRYHNHVMPSHSGSIIVE